MSKFTLKIKLPGYKLCLFSLHPHTLELSFGHFQTLKDQGYQKFTQKIEDFDIAETPKMSVFEPKKPTVNWGELQSHINDEHTTKSKFELMDSAYKSRHQDWRMTLGKFLQ